MSSGTEVVPAGDNATLAGKITKKVADPVVNIGEKLGVVTLRVTEDLTMKATHTIVDKTEEYTEKTLGHEKTEQLKVLGKESISIGTTAFHRMGGIANQFSVLVEETALGLLGVGKAASDIVTEGTETGEKVRHLVADTITKLEETTAKLTLYIGEGVEDNFCGTLTDDDRARLLKNSGGKGSFGLLLTLLASRDGENSVPLVVRLTTDRIRDRGAHVQGLFNDVAVDETELQELITKFDEDDNVSLDNVQNIHIVVELLKRFFLELPQPLLMTKNYDRLVKAQETPEDIAAVIAELPPSHRALLDYMQAFFRRMQQDAATNGATPQTLAQAFGPLWMRPPPGLSISPTESTAAVNVVRYIISNPERINELVVQYVAAAELRAKEAESDALLRRGSQQFVLRNYVDAIATWTTALELREIAVGRNHRSNAPLVANLAVAHTLVGNQDQARDLNARLQVLLR